MRPSKALVQGISMRTLAIPEGNSAIVEVVDEYDNDIIHVTVREDGDYMVEFQGDPNGLAVLYSDIEKIIDFARRNIEYVEPEALFPE